LWRQPSPPFDASKHFNLDVVEQPRSIDLPVLHNQKRWTVRSTPWDQDKGVEGPRPNDHRRPPFHPPACTPCSAAEGGAGCVGGYSRTTPVCTWCGAPLSRCSMLIAPPRPSGFSSISPPASTTCTTTAVLVGTGFGVIPETFLLLLLLQGLALRCEEGLGAKCLLGHDVHQQHIGVRGAHKLGLAARKPCQYCQRVPGFDGSVVAQTWLAGVCGRAPCEWVSSLCACTSSRWCCPGHLVQSLGTGM
jgi:hypothetical protein